MEHEPLLLGLSAILGAIVTGLAGPYFMQSKERRVMRAKVLDAIMNVEKSRWGTSSYEDLLIKISELKAVALMASADRKLVNYYVWLAEVSHRSVQVDEDAARRRWMPEGVAVLTEDTLEAVSLTLWHPLRTLPIRKWLLKKLKTREQFWRKQNEDPNLLWDPVEE